MANKIGGLDNRPVSVSDDRAVQRSRDSSDSGAVVAIGSGASSVQITGSARQLAQLEQQLQGLPAVDEARVAKIRDALETGQYQIDAERIADKMLRMEEQLSQKPSTEK